MSTPLLALALAWPAPALAAPPAAYQPYLEPFTTFDTLYMGKWRIDARHPYVAIDVATKYEEAVRDYGDGGRMIKPSKTPYAYRLHWDGTTLSVHQRMLIGGPDPNTDVTILPQAYADRFADVYHELRAGAPNLTFTESTPAEVMPDWEPTYPLDTGVWFRIHTPWTWDDDYAIYLFSEYTWASALSIHRIDDGSPLQLLDWTFDKWRGLDLPGPGSISAFNVPLDPDIASPLLPVPWNKHTYRNPDLQFVGPHGNRELRHVPKVPYHLAQQRVELAYDAQASSPPTPNLDHTYPVCADGPTVHTQPIDMRWAVPNDPDALQRLSQALQTCDVGFSMGLRAELHAKQPHQQVCIQGHWQVLSTHTQPPTVLREVPVVRCVQGPHSSDKDFSIQELIPPGAPAAKLAVRFVGQTATHCLKAGDPSQLYGAYAKLSTQERREGSTIRNIQPTLRWKCVLEEP